jgi:hypothetical protein
MALVGSLETISAKDGLDWRLQSQVNTENGSTQYVVYGSSGGILYEGSALSVIGDIQYMLDNAERIGAASGDPVDEEFFTRLRDAIFNKESRFNEQYPPTVDANAISSVNDFADVDKLAGSEAEGLTTDFAGISQKFSDLGGSLSDPQVVGNALGEVVLPVAAKFQSLVDSLIPPVGELIDGVKGQLSGLMGSVDSALKTLTGSGAGKLGVPNLNDVMGPITGTSPVMRAVSLDPTNPNNIAALNATVAQANSFFATAGIDLNLPAALNLGSVMSFGTALHKLGADPNGFGTANMLNAMATDDAYGEALKVSIAEGKNNELLAEAGIPAPVTDAPTDYTKDREKLEDEETKLLAEYDNISSLKGKLANVLKTAQKRTQMLVLDTEFSNDPELVAIDNEVLQSLTSLAGTLQRLIDQG